MNHSPFRYKWIFVLMLMLIGRTDVFPQEWNSARLTVLYGSSVPFNFNSIAKIKNGIEINPATRLGITMGDSAVVGHKLRGFVLNCRAFNNQAVIKGDAYSLSLNRIRVKAVNALGLEAGISAGYKDLTSSWVPVFTFTPPVWADLNWSNAQLNILLECGKPAPEGNGSLMGEVPDYYNVEIEFELEPTFF